MTAEEKAELPKPGERIQTWWCKDCGESHTAPVIGGLVVPPLEAPILKSLSEVQSERDEQEAA